MALSVAITTFTWSHVRFSKAGSLASPRQKLLTKSDLRVARMSSNTAFATGIFSTSASLRSFVAAMAFPFVESVDQVVESGLEQGRLTGYSDSVFDADRTMAIGRSI